MHKQAFESGEPTNSVENEDFKDEIIDWYRMLKRAQKA
jgi:hypothetical protein